MVHVKLTVLLSATFMQWSKHCMWPRYPHSTPTIEVFNKSPLNKHCLTPFPQDFFFFFFAIYLISLSCCCLKSSATIPTFCVTFFGFCLSKPFVWAQIHTPVMGIGIGFGTGKLLSSLPFKVLQCLIKHQVRIVWEGVGRKIPKLLCPKVLDHENWFFRLSFQQSWRVISQYMQSFQNSFGPR